MDEDEDFSNYDEDRDDMEGSFGEDDGGESGYSGDDIVAFGKDGGFDSSGAGNIEYSD
jgi:hypothetical protein